MILSHTSQAELVGSYRGRANPLGKWETHARSKQTTDNSRECGIRNDIPDPRSDAVGSASGSATAIAGELARDHRMGAKQKVMSVHFPNWRWSRATPGAEQTVTQDHPHSQGKKGNTNMADQTQTRYAEQPDNYIQPLDAQGQPIHRYMEIPDGECSD